MKEGLKNPSFIDFCSIEKFLRKWYFIRMEGIMKYYVSIFFLVFSVLIFLQLGFSQETEAQSTETQQAEETAEKPVEAKKFVPTLDEVRKKEKEMIELIEKHNEFVKLAKESKDYDEKKSYMEQADALKKQIEEVRTVYSDMVKEYNADLEQKRALRDDPKLKELYDELKKME